MRDYLHGGGLWAGQWETALIVAGISQPTVGSSTPWAGGAGLYMSGKKELSTSKQQASSSASAALLP